MWIFDFSEWILLKVVEQNKLFIKKISIMILLFGLMGAGPANTCNPTSFPAMCLHSSSVYPPQKSTFARFTMNKIHLNHFYIFLQFRERAWQNCIWQKWACQILNFTFFTIPKTLYLCFKSQAGTAPLNPNWWETIRFLMPLHKTH